MSTYHHGNLRPALVEAAVELARGQGRDGVVLREVARRTGVSHNATYRHFADREALLLEVGRVGMAQLEEAMRARLATVKETGAATRARRRLRALATAYVMFAVEEPGLFEVTFSGAESPGEATPPVMPRPSDVATFGLLEQVLDELVEAGVLPAARRPGAEILCWAAVHGFADLVVRGPLRHVPVTERDAALATMLDQVDAGFG